ncbi:MAG: hypothetical protein KDN22_13835 [Verrucomicrobiae bacterium]|nr:hypothetical protein [Verrucomicrobiae bacterium]
MKRSYATLGSIAVGTAVGLLLGYGIKTAVWRGHEDESTTITAMSRSEASRNSIVLSSQRRPSQMAQEREALERAPQTQRWLWLATQAETASASDMLRLIGLAGNDYELRKMLASQWGKTAPDHMLRTLVSEIKSPNSNLDDPGELLRLLFREWGERNANELAEALSDKAMFVGYGGLLMDAVSSICREDPGLGLRMLTEWDIQNYTPSLTKVSEWAATDPEAAGSVIGNMTNPYARKSAFEELAKTWVTTDPAAALQFAQTNLVGAAQRELSAAVMTRWAETNLTEALAFASSQEDTALLSALSVPLVEAWAKEDPAKALAWSEETLPAPARARAIGAIIRAIAEDDLQNGIAAVDDMAPGGAKWQASEALLQTWLKQPDLDVSALGEWLGDIDDTATQSRILQSVSWQWAREHPESAKAFISSERGHLAPSSMIRQLVQDDVRKDPHEAMDWALRLPESVAETAQKAVIQHWHQLQPAAAQEWALTEARGDQRTRAIEGISRELAFAGEERLRDWSDQLSADERRMARESLDAMRLAEKYAKVVNAVFGQ